MAIVYVMNDVAKDFLTVKEVLDRLKITKATLYKFIRAGSLKKYKFGKRTLLRESEVAQLIKTGDDLQTESLDSPKN